MSKEGSSFKIVFISIVVLIIMMLSWAALMMRTSGILFGMEAGSGLAALLPFALLVVLYVPTVAIFVYRDAARLGLNPWLWATIAAFIPGMVGLVIYLIIRTEAKIVCINCGKNIREDYKICPFCGQNQKLLCRKCNEPVAADWKVCPRCGQEIT